MIEHAVILAIASPNHVSALTKSRPHAMLPALGKPLVVRAMNQLLAQGIKKFIVVVGINEGSVASYLNNQWVPDAEIDFVLKSGYESLVSILSQIVRKLDRPFFLVNYNTFTQPQFITTALKLYDNYPDSLVLAGTNSTLSRTSHDAFALVNNLEVTAISSTRPEESQSSFLIANMAICGMHFVNYLRGLPQKLGTGSFQQQFIDILRFYAEQPQHQITLGRTSWIMQVNSDPDLMLLNRQLLENGTDAHILSELPNSVRINAPVRIDPGVSVGQSAVIGPYVYLESGCSVGASAQISNSLILDRASIPPGTAIENVIIAPDKIIQNQVS